MNRSAPHHGTQVSDIASAECGGHHIAARNIRLRTKELRLRSLQLSLHVGSLQYLVDKQYSSSSSGDIEARSLADIDTLITCSARPCNYLSSSIV